MPIATSITMGRGIMTRILAGLLREIQRVMGWEYVTISYPLMPYCILSQFGFQL